MGMIRVYNEVGKIKKALLHRPGNELINMTPSKLSNLLFDGIPYLSDAQIEHDSFAHVLKDNGVEVLYIEDLLTEVLSKSPDIKNKFIKQYMNEAGINTIKYKLLVGDYLNSINDPKTLILKTMEGIRIDDIPKKKREIEKTLSDAVNPVDKFIAEPMPNLLFIRDNFASVGVGVNLNKMSSINRNRESIYSEYVFKNHPDYSKTTLYYNRKYEWNIEGGDVLNLNEHVLAVGISSSTQSEAIDQLARNYFRDPICKIDTILAFNIPDYIHLDKLLTQVDRYTFLYYPSVMSKVKVFEVTEGFDPETFEDLNVRELSGPLDKILEKYMLQSVKLIPCVSKDMVASEREQYTSGVNVLCISPGVVISYDRNNRTNELLRKEGINVIEIKSSELSRGHGGVGSMCTVLDREDVDW